RLLLTRFLNRCTFHLTILSSTSKMGTLTSTVSGYFMPAPVFRTTTRSSCLIQLSSRNLRAAANAAAPSGQTNSPSSEATVLNSSNNILSLTEIAQPSVCLMTSNIKKSPNAFATLIPHATVSASSHGSADDFPSSHAFTIGAQ